MSEEKRQEWMSSISANVNPDDYLLGRKIDKTFELSKQEKAEQAREARLSLIASGKLRLTGDPILDLERKKEQRKMEIVSNPIRLRKFRERILRAEQKKQGIGQLLPPHQSELKPKSSRLSGPDRPVQLERRHRESEHENGRHRSERKRETSSSSSSSSSGSTSSSSSSSSGSTGSSTSSSSDSTSSSTPPSRHRSSSRKHSSASTSRDHNSRRHRSRSPRPKYRHRQSDDRRHHNRDRSHERHRESSPKYNSRDKRSSSRGDSKSSHSHYKAPDRRDKNR